MVSKSVLQNHTDISINSASGTVVAPKRDANFFLNVSKDAVLNYERVGSDLIIELKDGQKIEIRDFFLYNNNLVFIDGDTMWQTDFSGAFQADGDGILDANVLYNEIKDFDSVNVLLGLLGAAGIAGIGVAIGSSGGGGGHGGDYIVPLPPLPLPEAPGFDQVFDSEADIIANNGLTNDATPTFSGHGVPGTTINIYDDRVKIGTALVGPDGKWTFTPDQYLQDGRHFITITATDANGHESGPSDSFTLTVDTIAPLQPDAPDAQDNTGAQKGPIVSGGVTDETRPQLSGTGEAGAKVIITDNGKVIGETEVKPDGSWSWTPDTPLTEGDHSLVVSETDKAGNVSKPSDPLDFTVDTTPPVKPVLPNAQDNTGLQQGTITPGDATDETRPELSGTGEPGSKIEITDNGVVIGETVVKPDGSWAWTPDTDLAEGEHSLVVTETDKAGNVSKPSDPLDFAVDTTPPVQPGVPHAQDNTGAHQGPIVTGDVTDETRPQLSGTGEAGSQIIVKDKGVVIGEATVDGDGNWTLTPATPLDEGEHSITVTEIDKAGNESAPSDPLDFTVQTASSDSIAKITGISDDTGTSDNDFITSDNTLVIHGVVDQALDAGEKIQLSLDGGLTWVDVVYDADTLSWSYDNSSVVLDDGDYLFKTQVIDLAGNITVGEDQAVVIDTQGPLSGNSVTIDSYLDATDPMTGSFPSGSATNERSPVLEGQVSGLESGDVIAVYSDNQLVGIATVGSDGKWSLQLSNLSDGTHSYKAVIVDAAGNKGTTSSSFDFTVDTTAPAKPDMPSAEDKTGSIQGPIVTDGVTDETKPQLSGTGEAGSQIIVKDKGVVIGKATVDGDGNWTLTPDADLAEGEHSITVTEIDKAGNESAPSDPLDFTVDTTAPAKPDMPSAEDKTGSIQGPIVTDGVTDETRPQLSGTGEAGSQIIVKDKGVVIGEATVDGDGNWTLTPDADLAEGEHSITVTEIDKAGNESAPSDPLDFTVDTTAPAKPDMPGAEDKTGSIQGPIVTDGVTDETRPQLSGTGEAGSQIIVKDKGVVIGKATVDGDGNWTLTPATPLDEGEHSITVTEIDKAGNESAPSDPLDFTVDTTAPAKPDMPSAEDKTGSIQGPIVTDGVTDETRPQLSGTGEAGSQIIVKDKGVVIGEATVDGDGNWTLTPDADLAEGEHSITVTEIDKAGNESAPSDPLDFTVDTTAPAKPDMPGAEDKTGSIQGPIVTDGVTDETRPQLSGTGEAGSQIIVKDKGVVIGEATVDGDGNWTLTPDADLAEGEHSITVTEIDKAGNESAPSDPLDFTVDTTAPAKPDMPGAEDKTGSIQGPIVTDGVTDETRPQLSGTGEAGSQIIVKDKGVVIGKATVDGDGNWTLTPATPLDEGEHSITVTEIDKAGNESAPSDPLDFTVDTTAPAKPDMPSAEDKTGSIQGPIVTDGVTDETKPQLSGTGEAGSQIIVKDKGVVIGEATVDGDGNWTLTPATPLDEGEHSITVTEIDKAGNESAPSDPLDFTVDTTAPAKPDMPSAEDKTGSIQGPIVTDGVTDETRPQLSGTGEAGSQIIVKDKGVVIGEATVDGDGNWTLTPDADLAEGEHSITVTEIDKAGNESAPSDPLDFTVDTTAPAKPDMPSAEDKTGSIQGPIVTDGVTDETRPQLSGTGEAGSQIIVKDKGVVIGKATVDGDGNWTLTPDADLAEGEHSITVTEIDKAGNESAPSDPLDFTVQTASSDSIAKITGISDDTGTSDNDFITSDNTLVIHGVVDQALDAGEKIQLSLDGGLTWVDVVYDADTLSWSYDNSSVVLDDGDYLFKTQVIDLAGNITVGEDQAVVIDTQGPLSGNSVTIDSYLDATDPMTGSFPSGSATNERSPVLEGQVSGLESGDVIAVYSDNQLVGIATVGSDGKWSLQLSNLSDGTHSYKAVIVDAAGNKGTTSSSFDFTVDTTAPAKPDMPSAEDKTGSIQGPIVTDGVTDETRPQLSGTGEAGSQIIVKDKGVIIGKVTVDGDGNWTLTPDADLAEGEHSITVTEIDKAGNESAPSDPLDFTVDTTAPAKPDMPGAEDKTGSIQGPIVTDGVTDETRPQLSGTGEAGSQIIVKDKGVVIGEATVDGDGNWTLTPDADLAEGEHSITVTEIDKAGNESAPSDPLDFTVDTTAPAKPDMPGAEDKTGSIQGPIVTDGVTDETRPQLSGTGEAGSQIIVKDKGVVIGKATVDGDGNWTLTPATPLDEGEHSITVTEIDKAGNESAPSDPLDFTVDTTAPAKPDMPSAEDKTGSIQGPIVTDGVTDETKPQLSGTGEAGSQIIVKDKGVVIGEATVDGDGNWTLTPATPLDEGEHSITVTEIDKAGNESAPSDPLDFTVDTTAPAKPDMPSAEDKTGSIQGPIVTDGVTDETRPQLSGTGEAGSQIIVKDKGVVIGEATVDGDGNWTLTPDADLAEGEHSITVTEIDKAGNESAPSDPLDFTVDTTAPAKPDMPGAEDKTGSIQGPIVTDGVTDETRPQLSGTGEAGSQIIVKDKGVVIGEATVDGDGNWTLTPATPLDEGEHSITVTEIDKAGNESAPSDPLDFTVDTTAPAKPDMPSAEDKTGSIQGPIVTDGVTDETRPQLSGTGEAGSQIIVKDKGVVIGKATVDGDGNWTLTPDADLAEGEHSITVTEIDKAGNESAPSDPLDFTVQTASSDSIAKITGISDDTGTSDNDFITSDNTLVIHGVVDQALDAGEKIQLSLDGGLTWVDVVYDADTLSWSYDNSSVVLDDGDYLFKTQVIDLAGNITVGEDQAVVIDTQGPLSGNSVTIDSYLDATDPMTGSFPSGSATNERSPVLEGQVSGLESGDVIAVYSDNHLVGIATVGSDGKWSLQLSNLSDGTHSYKAVIVDAAGNKGTTSSSFDFTVDTTAPAKPDMPSAEDKTGSIQGPIVTDGVTDETRPQLSGTGEAGSQIIVKDKGVIIGKATVDGDGNWTLTPATPLDEGEHSITVTEIDKAGNESAPSDPLDFTVDTTAPAKPDMPSAEDKTGSIQGPIVTDGVTDETKPQLSGTGEAGSQIIVKDKGVVIGKATVDGDGNWMLTPDADLAEGEHSITVTEIDKAGNESAPSDPLDFTVDTTAPAKPDMPSAEDKTGSIQGPIVTDGVTDETRPQLSGTGEAGSQIIVKDKGVVIGEATVDGDGNWTLTPDADLAEGEHSITVTEIDKAGNESAPSDPLDFTVDTTAPAKPDMPGAEDKTGSIQGPIVTDGVTDETRPQLSGTGEAGSQIIVKDKGVVIGKATVDGDGNWTLTPATPLDEGEHSITVTEIDKAGNESAPSDPLDFTVDTTAPAKPDMPSAEDKTGSIQGPIVTDGVTDETRPQLSGTGEAGSQIIVKDKGVVIGKATVDGDGNWTLTPATPLDEGEHSITVTEIDKAGNESAPSDPLDFTVDTTAPAKPDMPSAEDKTGSIQGPIVTDGVTDETRPQLSGTGEAGSQIIVKDKGVVIGKATVDGDGNWTLTPATPLDEGEHSITVTEIDKAGNESAPSDPLDFTVKPNGSPVISTITGISDDTGTSDNDFITSDNTLVIHGVVDQALEAGDRIQISLDNGVTWHDVVYDADTLSWSYDNTGVVLDDGSYTFKTRVIDTIGVVTTGGEQVVEVNTEGPTQGYTLSIDRYFDDTEPVTGWNTSGSTTNDRSPLLEGKVSGLRPGDSIVIYDKTELIGTANVAEDGTWSYQFSNLSEDYHKYTAYVVDAAGNKGSPSNNFVLYVDTIPPTSTATLSAISDDTGLSGTDFVTNDNTLIYTISVDRALDGSEQVWMRITPSGSQNPGRWIQAKDNKDGTYTIDHNSAAHSLVDGSYIIETQVRDRAGNFGPLSSQVITIDTTPPAVPEVPQAEDRTGAEQGAIISGGVTDETSPEISGEGEVGSKIVVMDNGIVIGETTVAPDGKWSITPTAPLDEGAHSITVIETDIAGNESVPSDPLDFTVQLPVPEAIANITSITEDTGMSNSDFITNDNTLEIRGTVDRVIEAGEKVQLSMDNGKTWVDVIYNAGTLRWRYDNTSNALADGEYTFKTRVVNSSGIATPGHDQVVIIDTKPPTGEAIVKIDSIYDDKEPNVGSLPAGSTTNDGSPVLQGHSSGIAKGDLIAIHYHGSIIGYTTPDENGNWTYQLKDLANGDHYFQALVIDVAGNEGAWSESFSFKVDLAAHDAPVENTPEQVIDPLVTGTQEETSHTARFLNGNYAVVNDTKTADDTAVRHEGHDIEHHDTAGLISDGQDVLLYQLLDANDATGGNGHDVVDDFAVGNDCIDVSELLIGYNAEDQGPVHYVDGVATIDADDPINDYLSVTIDGNNTVLHIDRDGAGGAFEAAPLLTLNNVQVDLATLLANHQLLV